MSQTIRYSRFEVLQHPDGAPHVLDEDSELTIYLAQEKETGAPAVLRVPGPAVQRNPSARHRFLEEAREMSQVKHPNIAAVLHFGDTSAGAFCAMELCDGLTLEKAIEEVGALPWQEAFRLALQLSSALEALDHCGLVHRGLRPTNIIVTTGPDGHAHLKVTEYGRETEDSIRDTLAATKSGFIRVPAYASPEEFLAVAPPDTRSLQYALGAVLWFCLTTKPMFEGTPFEVMFQHVNKEPDWKKLPPLPAPVLAVMKLLLAKSAGDRFVSPAAVIVALRSALAGVTDGSKKPAALDAPTTGPTALAWLKARQTLELEEVYPLLAQIADLMDTAVADGSGMLDAALERVLIEIEGWTTLHEAQRAALLRTPLLGWPPWRVKLFPRGTSHEPVMPQAASFVAFCHRVLTGQGKGAGRHVPTAALSAEGNAFFEKYLGTNASRGLSCRGLLEMLCEAEEVEMEQIFDLGADPLATRVVTSRSRAGAQEPARGDQQQQAWLAREKEALERARHDLSTQEAERAKRMAEEQAHVEKLRRSLEEQKAQLEERRREQQRLEQELQLRAQLEFQKLQQEAKARESVLKHKRVAAEDALRQREEEFRAREQERFARLEKLKHENDAMEERVQQEYLTLRHVERKHAQLTQSTAAAKETKTPPVQTNAPKAPTAQYHPTGPTTAGSIILARLTPLEAPRITAPRSTTPHAARPPMETARGMATQRHRQRLVAILIGLLIAGVAALIVAAALTMFSETDSGEPMVEQDQTGSAEPEAPKAASSPVVVREAIAVPQASSPGDSLRTLISEAQSNPDRKEPLRSQALALVAAVAAQPAEDVASSAETLRRAAETWKLPEAWLALAESEADEDTKLEYYLQAARLGNVQAKSLAGRLLLAQGVRSRHGGIIQQATALLSEAISGGDAAAMLALGDALFTGKGPAENRVQGRALVERAASVGHEPAREWLRKKR